MIPDAPSPEPSTSPEPMAPPESRPMTVAELLYAVTPHAFVTPALSMLLVIAFGASVWKGVDFMSPTAQALLDVGGLFGPEVAEGQGWRLLSATFLHAGVVHLAFNLWALWNAGQFAERLFGNSAFALLYLLSGLGGSLVSLAVHPMIVGVGASGAVFGVYGGLLGFMLTHRGVLPPEFLAAQRSSLLGFLGYNLVFGLTMPNVDLSAHFGGLVVGVLLGVVLSRDLLDLRAHRERRVLGTLGVMALLVLVGVGVKRRLDALPEVAGDRHARAALAHLKAKRLEQAIEAYDQALAAMPGVDWTWSFNRGLAHLRLNHPGEALKDFRAAHAQAASPKTRGAMCEAASMGTRAQPPTSTLEEALRLCTDAVDTNPGVAGFLLDRAGVELHAEQPDAGLADATKALELSPGDELAHLYRAQALAALKHGADAVFDCQAIKPLESGDAWAQAICAEVFWDAKDPQQTLALLDAVLSKVQNAQVYSFRATVLEALERSAEALADLDEADRLLPGDPRVLNNRAWQRVAMGDFAGAERDARVSVQGRPDNANGHGTLCFALAGLGRTAEARAECETATRLNPGSDVDQGMLAFLSGRKAEAVDRWTRAAKANAVEGRHLRPWLVKAGARP